MHPAPPRGPRVLPRDWLPTVARLLRFRGAPAAAVALGCHISCHMTRPMNSPAIEPSPARKAKPRRRLLAVCPVPLWPATNGYSLRVTHLLPELAKEWEI